MAVLENEEGLVTRHPQTLEVLFHARVEIQDSVSGELCYSVHWSILDPHEVGVVPPRRRRLYVVAVKRCGRQSVPFTWPAPLPPPPLEAIYDLPVNRLRTYLNYPVPVGKQGGLVMTRRINEALIKVYEEARRRNVRPEDIPAICDAGGTSVNVGIEKTPCLAQARGKTLSFFKLQTAEFCSLRELFRLQGFSDAEVDGMRIHQKDSVIAGMLGNGFTKTVMQRVLKAAIAAAEAPA